MHTLGLVMGLFGGVLNAYGNVLGFFCWIITNLVLFTEALGRSEYDSAALFVFYTGICVLGIWNWARR